MSTARALAAVAEPTLVDLIREAGFLMAGEGLGPAVAARRVLVDLHLPAELLADLAADGLAYRLGNSLDGWRRGHESPVHPKLESMPPLALALVGADGVMKPLSEFTTSDCHWLINDARARRDAWISRGKLAGRMLQLLTANKVERLGDLPLPVQVELTSEVLEIWE